MMTDSIMKAYQLDQLAIMILLAIFKFMHDNYLKCSDNFLLLIHFETVTAN